VLHLQIYEPMGLHYDARTYKVIMMLMSWGRIPLLWASWIAFGQYYEYAFIFDVIFGMIVFF